jgi:hypothetical protein
MENQSEIDPFGDGVSADTKKIARDQALKFGLYLGIINVFMFLAIYFVNPLLLVTAPAFAFLLLVVGLGLDVYFCLELRKLVGGYWNFRLAFSSIFIMLLVAVLIGQVYQVVLYKVIDKELSQKMMDASLEKARSDMASRGLSSEQMDKQMDMVKGFIPDQGSLKTLAFGLLGAIVFSIILSLILAAIFKKEKPVFSTSA